MDKKTPVFDWVKGDFDSGNGVVQTVTGAAAVEQIVIKALQTPRGRALIYADIENEDRNHKYGNDVPDVITADIDDETKLHEIKRAVADALSYDPWIKSVDDVTVERTGTDEATADIDITTIYDTKVTVKGVAINA